MSYNLWNMSLTFNNHYPVNPIVIFSSTSQVYIHSNGSLCRIIAVLPATSVDCERGFSSLSRIKNDVRNGLKTKHLGCFI